MIISIKEEINDALDYNKSATDLIDNLNQYDENDIVMDFEGVFFISRSFAQAYYASKKRSSKHITEINFSGDVKPLMEMIEKQIIGD